MGKHKNFYDSYNSVQNKHFNLDNSPSRKKINSKWEKAKAKVKALEPPNGSTRLSFVSEISEHTFSDIAASPVRSVKLPNRWVTTALSAAFLVASSPAYPNHGQRQGPRD